MRVCTEQFGVLLGKPIHNERDDDGHRKLCTIQLIPSSSDNGRCHNGAVNARRSAPTTARRSRLGAGFRGAGTGFGAIRHSASLASALEVCSPSRRVLPQRTRSDTPPSVIPLRQPRSSRDLRQQVGSAEVSRVRLDDYARRDLRLCHTTPATAPSVMTAPIAMNHVTRVKTTPIFPYNLLSETRVEER